MESFTLYIRIIRVFIGILGDSFEIQFLAILFIDLVRDLIKVGIIYFIRMIRVFIGILGAP